MEYSYGEWDVALDQFEWSNAFVQQMAEDPRRDRIPRFLILVAAVAAMHRAHTAPPPYEPEEIDVAGWPAIVAKLLA